MLAMKMNVWEQICLFLGDLSLALYERETGWVGRERERGWRGKQIQNKKDGGEERQLLFS